MFAYRHSSFCSFTARLTLCRASIELLQPQHSATLNCAEAICILMRSMANLKTDGGMHNSKSWPRIVYDCDVQVSCSENQRRWNPKAITVFLTA